MTEFKLFLQSIRNQEDRKHREQLVTTINNLEKEGWIVSYLRDAENDSVEQLEARLQEFMENIRAIEDHRKELNGMNLKSHYQDVQAIRDMMNDPMNAPKIKTALHHIEELLKKESEERLAFMKIRERWRYEGYDVSCLDHIFEEELPVIRDTLEDYRVKIEGLKNIHGELKTLKIDWFPKQIMKVEQLLKSPEKFEEALKEFHHLRELQAYDQKLRAMIEEKVKPYFLRRYNIKPIKIALDEKPIKEVKDEFK